MRHTGWWFLAAGVLVTIRAAIELTSPSYWAPVSVTDYAAVVGTTVAWLATSWAIVLLARAPQLRRAKWLLIAAALGTAISAVGNLLEDLFDIAFGGPMFVWGGMIGALGFLLGGTLALTVSNRLRWSGLFLLVFLAGGVFPDEGGQFVSGVALLGLGGWLILSPRSGPSADDAEPV